MSYSINTTKLQTDNIDSVTHTTLNIATTTDTKQVNIGNKDTIVYINGSLYNAGSVSYDVKSVSLTSYATQLNLNSSTTVSNNNFIGCGFNTNDEFSAQIVITKECIINNLYCLSDSFVADDCVFNIRRNGENTNMYAVILKNEKIGRDTTNSFNCLVGDILSIQFHGTNLNKYNCSLLMNYEI